MQCETDSQAKKLQPVAKQWVTTEWNREKERSHRTFNRFARSIADAAKDGKNVAKVVRAFLGDPKARLSSALRALGGQPEPEEAFTLRNRVNLRATSYPPVFWYPMHKASGGFRPICILPPELKAAHYMLATAVTAQFPESPALYGLRCKGITDALRELKTLQNAGFVYLAKTDIKSCFQSINPDALYQLPLPTEVIRQTLDHRYLTFTGQEEQQPSQAFARSYYPVYTHAHKASGPTGLLQGSPASSAILAWLLKDIPTSEDVRVMLCFDNIVVAARTPEASRQMMETLTAYLRHCPAGPLALCEPFFADNQPLEFLGGLFDPARAEIGIAEGTLSRIERRLREAEDADLMELQRIWVEHMQLILRNALFLSLNPFQGRFPTDIWHILRDAYAGLPFVEADCPELQYLLETAAATVDVRNDFHASNYHRSLFSPADKKTLEAIRYILRINPRKQKGKR